MDKVQQQLPHWLRHSKNNLAVIFDSKGNITDCNELFAAALITEQPESINYFFSEHELLKFWNMVHSLLLNNHQPANFVSHHKTGNIYQWEFFLKEEEYIIGIAQQHNAVKRTESLISVDHLIDSFMNNSPASAWICDANGHIITMNKYYLSFTGLTHADIGKTLWEIFPGYLADLYQRNNNIVLESGKILKTEELSIDTNGVTRNFLVYKFPLNTIDNKKLVGGWAVDITERKAAEQKIFKHDIKIKELAFLQSHEVRRPLANMLGLLELIKADSYEIEDEQLKSIFLYIQLSATELDNEIKKVIDKLQEE
jgi:PAS domain S-box-containing protein